MSQLFEVKMPSVGTNGQPVVVGTSATTLHTAISGSTQADEVWVWLSNVHSSTASWATVLIGGFQMFNQIIPAGSQVLLIVPGIRINNSLAVTATASNASSIVAITNINRITL